ncbi:MAG: DUF3015 domain-containing protein [Gammaproteobacteria bacterium]|nr:DUF3015 domain-containing protein [Gammaproteobacteria bacterium]MDH5650682.1 DUF3015 domain-containing protein [Gammaproteobacteria bacterium]
MKQLLTLSALLTLAVFLQNSAMAGCKLGDFIPKEFQIKRGHERSNIISHITSSTTSSVTYAFARMSSTSGCGKGRGRAKLEQEYFLQQNRIYLLADISRGGGEYLSSFSQLLGCHNAAQPQLSHTLQGNLIQLMPEKPLPTDSLLNRIHTISNSDPVLNKSCRYIG